MRLACVMACALVCSVAAARDEVPRVAPQIELIGTVSPAAKKGWYTIAIDEVVTDPQKLFEDNPPLRGKPLLTKWLGDGEPRGGRSRWRAMSPDATAGQWRLLEARPVAASEPAVHNGLQIIATLDRTSFAADEDMTLHVELTNVTDKPMSLPGAATASAWQIAFNERGVERERNGKKSKAKTVVLKPGETLNVPLGIDPAKVRFVWRAPSGEAPPLDQLEPGDYLIRVSRLLRAPDEGKPHDAPFWTGLIASDKLAVTITAPKDADAKFGRVTGRVLDAHGAPVGNARVSIMSASNPGKRITKLMVDPISGAKIKQTTRANIITTYTNDDGVFEADIEPADDVVISVYAEAGGAGKAAINVPAGQTTNAGNFKLLRGEM